MTIGTSHVEWQIPTDAFGISIHSQDWLGMPYKQRRTFRPFLGQFSQRAHVTARDGNTYEVFDAQAYMVAAHEVTDKIYVTNLQEVMQYCLVYYIILQKMQKQRRGYAYYRGYLVCRDLISWAAQQYIDAPSKRTKYIDLLPTASVYGKNNHSESYRVWLTLFEARKRGESLPKLQPRNMYSNSMRHKTIPDNYLNFDYGCSHIFQIDGAEYEVTKK
jgi:hypothetical protein